MDICHPMMPQPPRRPFPVRPALVTAGVVLGHVVLLGLLFWAPARPKPILTEASVLPIQWMTPTPEDTTPPAAAPATPPKKTTVRPAQAVQRPQPKPPEQPAPTPPLSTTASSVASASLEASTPPATAATTAATTPSVDAPSSATAPAAPAAPPKVELPSSSADYLNNPRPPYPPLSKRLGEQGKVVLRVYIEADGTASQANVLTSSGYDRLDQTAQQTVLRWRYVPGKRNGEPQAMWFNVPIQFVLE